MVLAAGLGTRLWPLTLERAKPAVPFLGKPLIEGTLELLARYGITRAVVNTHHLPESIHDALASPPIEVRFIHEGAILGTGGALSNAREHGLLDPSEPTLIINAKLYTDIDLEKAMRAHDESGALVTVLLRPNPARELFREVLVEGGRVVGFGEGKEPTGASPLLFTGIHIIEPEVLRGIPLGPSDTVATIYPPLIERREVAAHVDPDGRWWEFSTLERYLELHLRAAEEGLGPGVCCSAGAAIEPGALAARSVLWEDALVKAGAVVEAAVLGRGVVVSAGETVKRTAVVRDETGGLIRVPIRLDAGH
jgi:NDP-sugar pyrophosphorylase family protein